MTRDEAFAIVDHVIASWAGNRKDRDILEEAWRVMASPPPEPPPPDA